MTLSDRQPEPLSPETVEQSAKRIWFEKVPVLKRSGRWIKWGILVLLLVLAFLGPTYLSVFDLTLAFTLFNYMTLAQSWNLLGGYGGQFSLGHSLVFGVVSYTVAVLLLHCGMPLYLTLLASGCLASGIAAIAALLLIRFP